MSEPTSPRCRGCRHPTRVIGGRTIKNDTGQVTIDEVPLGEGDVILGVCDRCPVAPPVVLRR